MSQVNAKPSSLTARLKMTTRRVFIWTLLWLISTALLAFGPKFIWDFEQTWSVLAIVLNLLLGLKMLLANKAHLNVLDEMQRKIHFNAMAVSLGITMITGTVYGLLEPAKILASTPNPSNLLFVMGFSYLIAIMVNNKAYS